MRYFAVIAALAVSPAWAQFKCTGADGKVAFQQQPCERNQKAQQLAVKPIPVVGGTPGPAGDAAQPSETERIRRQADQLGRERRVFELQTAIRDLEAAIAGRNAAMERELQALKQRKAAANNNLAGAVWEQSLSGEMQAVAEKYRGINELDLQRLATLRADLERARDAAGRK